MRGNHSFINGAVGAASALMLLAGCATMEDVPPPQPVEAEPVAPPEAPAPESQPYEMAEPAVATEQPFEPGAPPPEAVAEEPVQLREDAPLRYVVKKGDTLWDISQRFLQDNWQWPELWYANPDVQNPHLIYPGDVLYLRWIGGRPQVVREGEEPGAVVGPVGTDKLQPRARESRLEEAIYSIPLELIRGFLRGPRVVSKDEIRAAPYVVAFEENRLAIGDDAIAYALEVNDRSIVNYRIVRIGEEYRDPDDGDLIGYEALPVADTEVRVWGEPATIYLSRSDIETRVGDILLPADLDPLPARFVPHAPSRRVDGRIISVYNGLSQIGQYQVVAINRGTEVGLEPGHVLSVLQTGRKAKDPKSFWGSKVQLPDIKAGEIMVFKVAPRLSYGLIMTALREIHILDRVETPDPDAQ